MNLYFGVAVNAARGIATQVDAALKQFVNNFTTAVNPQITKSYAQGDLDYMHKLICRSAKFSAFLTSTVRESELDSLFSTSSVFGVITGLLE